MLRLFYKSLSLKEYITNLKKKRGNTIIHVSFDTFLYFYPGSFKNYEVEIKNINSLCNPG